MAMVNIELFETDYQRLVQVASQFGKPVQEFLHDWIAHLPEVNDTVDVTQDPVFQMEGYDAEAPSDLSVNLDTYLYGEKEPA